MNPPGGKKAEHASPPKKAIFWVVCAAAVIAGILWSANSIFLRRNDLPPAVAQLPEPPKPSAAPSLQPAQKQLIEAQFLTLSTNRTSAEAWGRYGMVLKAFELDQEALQCFLQAEAMNENDPRWPYFLYRLLRGEKPAEALGWLKLAVKRAGNDPLIARYQLAKWLGEEGRWDEAEQEAGKLLQSSPDFQPAWLIQGQVALGKGELEKAAELATACTHDPRTRKAAWALLGAVYGRQGKSAAASEASQKSTAAAMDRAVEDPWESEVASLRGNPKNLASQVHPLLATRKFAEAAPLIEELTTRHPELAETWLVQGRYHFLQKNGAAAEKAFKRHLELEPKSIQGLFQLGMVYLNTGNLPAAEQAFRSALHHKQDFAPAWFNLGVALGRGRKMVEAAAALEQAIRCSPEHLDSYFLLADASLQINDYPKAELTLAQAEKVNPADPRIIQFRKRMSGKVLKP